VQSIQFRVVAISSLLVACTFAGCAADVSSRYPSPATAPVGVLVVEFSYAVSNVSVTVDGELVVKDEYTDEVRVEGVPAGTVHVVVTGGDGASEPLERAYEVEIVPGRTHTVAVAAPRVTDGAWIYLGAEFLGLAIMYASLLIAL
jgi:hypothetical protein